MKKIIIPKILISPKEREEISRARYKEALNTVENMSYWLPKIQKSVEESNTGIRIPKTKIIPLSYDRWIWLNSDDYKEEQIDEFNEFLLNESKEFLTENNKLFMKTGLFSDKFDFEKTIVTEGTKIGYNFLNIFYASMIVGASNSAEVVLREFIESKIPLEKIYNGMNLFTEFRVFYDFDKKEVLGVSNYWNPDVMKRSLRGDYLDEYTKAEKRIVKTFKKNKKTIVEKISKALSDVQGMEGAWSVDILLNVDEFWLIDMARMERSALVSEMEKIK